ncbi:MAG: hypothetical protein NTV22_10285 [bacterium]|nr:hypothetical protein [bacterium]
MMQRFEHWRWRWHRLQAMPLAELCARGWRRVRRRATQRAIMREQVPATLSAVLAHADCRVGALATGAVSPPLAPAYQAGLLEAAEHV